MYDGKFVDLSREKQLAYVCDHFIYKKGEGWHNSNDEFCGQTKDDVIRAMIDLEDAEINSIGDCMSGYCVTPPQFMDFVQKK